METIPRFILFVCLASAACMAQRQLAKYNVDRTQISVSGVSSGAAMATQVHVAYSTTFMGVGVLAGNPYYCAEGSSITATNACMSYPERIDIPALIKQTNKYASSGDVDATMNMYNDKVFIFAGTLDSTVNPGIALKVDEYYRNYVNGANIKTVTNVVAEHTVPTIDYGNACTVSRSPYISKCNYNAAFEILNHIYGGGLTRPTGTVPLNGDFYLFDQSEFFYISPPALSSMDKDGYVYVPSGCVFNQNRCKLHVAIHGCRQGRHVVDDEFAMHGGYNEVGELNNIIILYPQAIAVAVNPMGCWDWWGYTINNYATKGANQPLAIKRFIDRIS